MKFYLEKIIETSRAGTIDPIDAGRVSPFLLGVETIAEIDAATVDDAINRAKILSGNVTVKPLIDGRTEKTGYRLIQETGATASVVWRRIK